MSDVESKMNSAVLHFEKELNSLRTSRANPSMLDNILVDAYGSKTPVNQLGNISVQDASTISIQIWDSSLIKSIENALQSCQSELQAPQASFVYKMITEYTAKLRNSPGSFSIQK